MGLIIQFPINPPYPDHAVALDPAERVLLIAIRGWVEAYRRNEDPLPGLCHGLEAAGPYDAAFSVDALMAILERTIEQPITIHCPHCAHLSDDERHLLHAASLVQAGHNDLAENALRHVPLSPQGAAFALGPLSGLGGLFAEAGLFFRRRRPPAENQMLAAPWQPATTIH